MKSSGKRLLFVLAFVFALAACRFTWLFMQPNQYRVQAQNVLSPLSPLRRAQKIAMPSLTTNCDSQRQSIQRLGDFPILQLASKDVAVSHAIATCQSRLILQHHGVIAITGVTPDDFSKLTGIAVPSARIAFHQILSKLQIRPKSTQSKAPERARILRRPSTPGAWISNPSAQQITGPTTTLQSPSMLAAHVDALGITHLYEDYRPATTTTAPRLNQWVERQRQGLQVLPVQKKPSLRSALKNFFSLPTVYAQGVPPAPSAIPGWTLVEEVTLSWEDGYQNAFEVAAWVLRQNESTVGDNYAVITNYQSTVNTAGMDQAMEAVCSNGNWPSNGFCGSSVRTRTISYTAISGTSVLPQGNVGGQVTPQLANPQPASQNLGCTTGITASTNNGTSVGGGLSGPTVASTSGNSQGVTQSCTFDQVDTSLTAQSVNSATWTESFGDSFWGCISVFRIGNAVLQNPTQLASECPFGPPSQATGNFTSVQGAIVSFPQDTVSFAGTISGTTLVDAGGTCWGTWWQENINWGFGGKCTDYQMESDFQLDFNVSAPTILIQACEQAFTATGTSLTSQLCVPTNSTNPSGWWAGQTKSLALQSCAYLTNYNPVITIQGFSTIPSTIPFGAASGSQGYFGPGTNQGFASQTPFSSTTSVPYTGAMPSWTLTAGPGLQINQTPSAPDPNTGISTATANLTPPSNGYTPPNVSMVVNASPTGSAWTFDSATAPQGLAVNVSVQPWPTITSLSPSTGVPGTVVTAQGTGFLSNASMCFGSSCVPASSVNLTGTQISAPAPLEWGAVPVTVENSAGCLSQNSVQAGPFEYLLKPCTGFSCTLCERFPILCSHSHLQYPINNIWGLYLKNGWVLRPVAYPWKNTMRPLPPGPGPLSWVVLSDVNPVNVREQHLNISRGVLVQAVLAGRGSGKGVSPLHAGDVIEAVDGYPVANTDAMAMVLQRPGQGLQSQFLIYRNHMEAMVRLTAAP